VSSSKPSPAASPKAWTGSRVGVGVVVLIVLGVGRLLFQSSHTTNYPAPNYYPPATYQPPTFPAPAAFPRNFPLDEVDKVQPGKRPVAPPE
jgi:hypothetical protein